MPLSSYWVEPISDDDVVHYGVKGMKWGVRKQKRAYYRGLRQYNRYQKKKTHARDNNNDEKYDTKSREAHDRAAKAARELHKHGYNEGHKPALYVDPKTRKHTMLLYGAVAKNLTVEQCIKKAEKRETRKWVGIFLGSIGAASAAAVGAAYMESRLNR